MSFLNLSWADPKILVDEEGDAAEEIADPREESPDAETNTEESDGDPNLNEGNTGENEEEPAENSPSETEPATEKISVPKFEAGEGVFQRLTVAMEAVFENLVAKTAKFVSAFV